MSSEAKLFNTEKQLEFMKEQAVINSQLKERVSWEKVVLNPSLVSGHVKDHNR